MDKKHPEDALGQPIKLGAKYGYSINSSGVTTVVTGILEKVTEKKVTLRVETRKRFLYGEPAELHFTSAGAVSLHPCHLFPIKD